MVLAALPAVAQSRNPTEPALGRPEELACAPALGWREPDDAIRIVGSQEGAIQRMYGPGSAIVLDAGSNRGLQAGQEFYVRRLITPTATRGAAPPVPQLRQTAGWIRLLAVEQNRAVAEIVYACDGLAQGDFVEPFELPAVPAPADAAGQPDFANPGTILFGEEGATVIGEGQFVVISRGTDHGLAPGQWLTLFRASFGAAGPVTQLGQAVVVGVAADSATARVLKLRDAAYAGDLVALHRD